MKPVKTILMGSAFCMAIISCRKQVDLSPQKLTHPLVERTVEEESVAGLTGEVAGLLEKVYQDSLAYREVNATINCGYYEDERVLLGDLLDPERSSLYASTAFREQQAGAGIFRKRFLEEVRTGSYPRVRKELGESRDTVNASALVIQPATIGSGLASLNKLCVYFPYSEEHVPGGINTSGVAATIVSTDRHADSGPGREPFKCSLGSICYRQVLVDDNYAVSHPTHIVGVGADPVAKPGIEPPKETIVNMVYHGWGRLTRQMDKLISFTGNGGGSEIKLGRISAYLKTTNQQVTGFTGDLVTVYFTRGEIRKSRWKRIFSIWDPNWTTTDKEEIYAVYEDDTEGSSTFNGSLNVSVSIPGEIAKVDGKVGYEVKVKTQDNILTQRKFDRTSYYRGALLNQGWGFIRDDNDFLQTSLDWPIYDGAAVWQFTMANREY